MNILLTEGAFNLHNYVDPRIVHGTRLATGST